MLPYGIYQCDPRTDRFLDVNPALVEMLGYASKQELLAIGTSKSLYADPSECEAFVQECRLNGRSESDMAWKRKDGKQLRVRARGRQSRAADGGLRLEVYVEDISKRAELEQQLRQAQKMEAVGNLAGGVAHDFNNLLMIISSYTQMMEDELAPEDRMRQNTRQVLKAVAALQRADSAIACLQPQADIVASHPRHEFSGGRNREDDSPPDRRRHRIDSLLERPLWVVKADPDQIGQVLLNLCVNARDAMPRGGTTDDYYPQLDIGRGCRGTMPGVVPGHVHHPDSQR